MSRFVNEKISFNNSTFNQVAGNLHDGDVTHVYGRLVNSNNYNSNNVTGSGNVIGSNNTSSSRVHPYREYYDAGWRYRHHRYGGPEQRPSHQRAQGMRVRGSRRGRQSTAESSQSEEYYTASESGSEEGECSPPYKVQQPPQQAASSDPPLNFHGSSAYRSHRGEASTCAPSRSSSRATRSSSNQPLTQIRTLPSQYRPSPHPSDESYESASDYPSPASEDGSPPGRTARTPRRNEWEAEWSIIQDRDV